MAKKEELLSAPGSIVDGVQPRPWRFQWFSTAVRDACESCAREVIWYAYVRCEGSDWSMG